MGDDGAGVDFDDANVEAEFLECPFEGCGGDFGFFGEEFVGELFGFIKEIGRGEGVFFVIVSVIIVGIVIDRLGSGARFRRNRQTRSPCGNDATPCAMTCAWPMAGEGSFGLVAAGACANPSSGVNISRSSASTEPIEAQRIMVECFMSVPPVGHWGR